jgi:ribA/ribD-fused uncharacterized protein
MATKSFKGPNLFLSNFTPCSVELDGVTYPSVEHAYQAAKTTDPNIRALFLIPNLTAGKTKRMAKTLKIREDWNDIRVSVMESLLRQKFASGSEFAKKLIALEGDIVEGNYWHDNFWGSCTCEKCGNTGENTLGKLLMRLRTELSSS